MVIVSQLLDLKGRQVHSIGPDEPVLRAMEVMATHDIGALLVTEGSDLRGVISERDYARKIILMKRSSRDTPVRDIMTSPVYSVQPTDTVHHCMQLMTGRRIRHLPVLLAGKVDGLLSIGDLVKVLMQEQSDQIQQLERYIAG